MKSHLLFRLTCVCASIALLCGLLSLVGGTALAAPINPGFDLLTTPPGGGVLDLSSVGGPANFPLVGRPIGPSNTDSIVQRFGGLPPGGTGIIPAELVALSLESINPAPIGSSFFDVFVDLNPAIPSTGNINVTTHLDPIGGTFNSSFNVNSRVTFTEVGNPLNQMVVLRTDPISSTNSPWSHFAPPGYPNVPRYPSGNFYPGAVGGSSGVESQSVGINHTGPHPHTDPAYDSDVVRIYDPQLDPPNASKDFVIAEPTVGEPFLAAFYGPVGAPNQWISFLEPNGDYSDRLSVRNNFLYFESDPLGHLFPDLPPLPIAVVVENGKFQRVDQFFEPFPGYVFPRIDVFSDLVPDPDIPEPGSVLLLLIGGIGLGLMRRIRRA